MNYREQMNRINAHIGKITKLYYDIAKSQGISYNAMMVLYTLEQTQSCTQKQIAEECGLPKQSVNSIIKNLHNAGHVELLTGKNKKEKLVAFTDTGKTYADEMLEPIFAIEEHVLQRMGEDSQHLERSTEKFADIFSTKFINYQDK